MGVKASNRSCAPLPAKVKSWRSPPRIKFHQKGIVYSACSPVLPHIVCICTTTVACICTVLLALASWNSARYMNWTEMYTVGPQNLFSVCTPFLLFYAPNKGIKGTVTVILSDTLHRDRLQKWEYIFLLVYSQPGHIVI